MFTDYFNPKDKYILATYYSLFCNFQVKVKVKEYVPNREWCLHFDGKQLEKHEYQAVILTNPDSEIRLAALNLDNGKSETIANGISQVIDEFSLWSSIRMMIADTAPVNTGPHTGVVAKLQTMFTQKGYEAPQFISCQHHVLDRILRLVMDQLLGENKLSPNIEYSFVKPLIQNYEALISQFVNGTEEITDKGGWREDMHFLYHLTRILRFYTENGRFPLVKFQKIPNLSNARWNSRAILALLAFILMPDSRVELNQVCLFISTTWADRWFSDQKFRENDFSELEKALKPYKSALGTLKRLWKKEPSVIDIPRSNQCCERAIRVMQDNYHTIRDKTNISLRFIATNKLSIN